MITQVFLDVIEVLTLKNDRFTKGITKTKSQPCWTGWLLLKIQAESATGPPPPIVGLWIFGVKPQSLTPETFKDCSFREQFWKAFSLSFPGTWLKYSWRQIAQNLSIWNMPNISALWVPQGWASYSFSMHGPCRFWENFVEKCNPKTWALVTTYNLKVFLKAFS